jgi:hypothetical protein
MPPSEYKFHRRETYILSSVKTVPPKRQKQPTFSIWYHPDIEFAFSNTIFWKVTLCSPVEFHRRFGGIESLSLLLTRCFVIICSTLNMEKIHSSEVTAVRTSNQTGFTLYAITFSCFSHSSTPSSYSFPLCFE